jgi:anthranilate synthase
VRLPAGGRAPGEVERHLEAVRPDLVVLSPGPGRPEDFRTDESLGLVVGSGVAVFGVCLGMQAIVEHFGGTLGQLPYPVHGKASTVTVTGGKLFHDVPGEFLAGRYHSLFAERSTLPGDLVVTAEADDGIVMAVEHRHLPIAGVQFHPESVMTMRGEVGLQIVANALAHLVAAPI